MMRLTKMEEPGGWIWGSSFSSIPSLGYYPFYGQYTYKIENGICYASYDTRMTWIEVPIR